MDDFKKSIFWVTSGLITVTVTVLWFLAIGKLDEERTQQTSSIKTIFSNMDNIQKVNDNNHPNSKFKKGMEEIMTQIKFDIHKTWDAKYNSQKTAFNWPTANGELDQITANSFIPLTPIELKVEASGVINPDDQENPVEVKRIARTNYADFLKTYLPKLAEQIDADWGENESEAGGFGGEEIAGFGAEAGGNLTAGGGTGAAPAVEEGPDHMVAWESGNQNALNERFTFTETPSTLQILYTQEDLWILQQWLAIIKDLNKEAVAAYNAKVTEIIGIDLARNGDNNGPNGVDLAKDAILNGGKVMTADGGGSGADALGGMDMMQQMSNSSTTPEGGQGASDSNTAGTDSSGRMVPTDDPGDLRYVDAKYKPLRVAELREALDPNSRKANPELAVSKRYPTRIRLKLDMRYLSQFLAACGNAELGIEVLQVRIGGDSGINKGGAGGGAGGMQGTMSGDMAGGMSGGMEGMMGTMDGGEGAATVQAAQHPYHQEVEVYGIVHIYNPPNPTALGIDPDEQQANQNNNDPADAGDPADQGQPADVGAE